MFTGQPKLGRKLNKKTLASAWRSGEQENKEIEAKLTEQTVEENCKNLVLY
jgi:hypothetical protein